MRKFIFHFLVNNASSKCNLETLVNLIMTSRPHFQGVTAGKKIHVFKFGLILYLCVTKIIK